MIRVISAKRLFSNVDQEEKIKYSRSAAALALYIRRHRSREDYYEHDNLIFIRGWDTASPRLIRHSVIDPFMVRTINKSEVREENHSMIKR